MRDAARLMDKDSVGAATELFQAMCVEAEFPVSERQAMQFVLYGEWLREWNERFNLTAITEWKDIFVKHFLDSAYALIAVERTERVESVLDVGSGAGFPGLVWKLLRPDLRLTLCDSLRKRTQFLEFVISGLELSDVVVVHARAEELAAKVEFRERFATVTARAVARLPTLIELATPLVAVGGSFHALKGPTSMQEVDEAKRSLAVLRCALKAVEHYVLPGGAGNRSVITIAKTGATPARFPRRPGDAGRHPIGVSEQEDQ